MGNILCVIQMCYYYIAISKAKIPGKTNNKKTNKQFVKVLNYLPT